MVKLRIIADVRERTSKVPDILREFGVLVESRMLEVGDYIVSSSCAVERKEVSDFLKSLYSGRLFDQIDRLSRLYEYPILIVEGELTEMLSNLSKPRSFWGAILAVAFDYNSNIFFTGEPKQTADLLYILAKRKRSAMKRGPIARKMPKTSGYSKSQLMLVSALPSIGPKLADRLLKHFGTARAVFSASVTELSKVRGVGRTRSERIATLLDSSYASQRELSRQIKLIEKNENLP